MICPRKNIQNDVENWFPLENNLIIYIHLVLFFQIYVSLQKGKPFLKEASLIAFC